MARPILLIDDDVELAQLLTDYLGGEGHVVEHAADGRTGLERALELSPALVILDVMLPGKNGFEVLRELRQRSDVPVLMLTARGDDVDRIVGLEIGADDYLGKPFNPRELSARIRAILRRTEPASSDAPSSITVDDVTLEPGARRVVLREGGATRELEVTSVEFALLELFLKNAGRVLDRDELSEKVLGRRFSPYDRSIDVHVSNLRRKVGEGRIKTVRGSGYLYARSGR